MFTRWGELNRERRRQEEVFGEPAATTHRVRRVAAGVFVLVTLVAAPSSASPDVASDSTPPAVAVSGALVDADGEVLEAQVARAEILATDALGSDTGVESLEIEVDGISAKRDQTTCSERCAAEVATSFAFDGTEWPGARHEIVFRARDAAGNEVERSIVVADSAERPTACSDAPAEVVPGGQALAPREAKDIAPQVATERLRPTYAGASARLIDPALRRPADDPDRVEIAGTPATGTLTTTPAGAIDLDFTLCLTPLETTVAAAPAHLAGSDAAVFANSAPDTDTVVRPAASGATIIQSIRGAEAPPAFSWAVGVPEGAELQELGSGGIAVVDGDEGAEASDRPQSFPDPNAYLAGVRDQLAAQRYEIAAAEAETGRHVFGVIPAPVSIDVQGNTQPARLDLQRSDEISVERPDGSRALVVSVLSARKPNKVKVPDRWRSYPLNQVEGNLTAQARQDACDFESRQKGGRRALLIFLVGRANQKDGKFGVGDDGNFRSNERVYNALLSAGKAYRDCRSSRRKRVDIAYGVTNYELSQEIATQRNARRAGAAQARVALKLSRRFPRGVGGVVAGDIEPGWDPGGSGMALSLTKGAARPKGAYYNFGTAGQCRPYGSGCQGNWTYADIGKVSQDKGIIPLPEIYYPRQGKTWDRVASRWDLLPGRCRNPRRRECYDFGGVTSYPVGCAGVQYSSRKSWLRMRKATSHSVGRRIIYFNPRRIGC